MCCVLSLSMEKRGEGGEADLPPGPVGGKARGSGEKGDAGVSKLRDIGGKEVAWVGRRTSM
jgi:hypothetical protein